MRKFLKLLFFLISFFLITASAGVCFADGPQPPGPPGGHGLTENQGPFDAPVRDGIVFLLVLGIGYGGFVFYKTWKKISEENKGRMIVK
ncbi:MAG: hypothetical protein NTU98_15080 [Bacteroidetes bacterium]|nr:hypothetical protein [Bacteroidota bacterium]